MSDRQKLERYSWITLGVIVIGICLFIFIENVFGFILGLGLIGGALYFNHITQICPHCSESLWGMRFIPDHCPHCGKRIE